MSATTNDIVMYEGSAKEISEADFNAALKFGQEAIQPLIAAQKELVAKAGKKKREITLNIVPDEILQEAKKLAGDRFVPALLTPGKLAREAAVQGDPGRSRRETRRKIRRGKSHRLRHQRRVLLHPKGSRPRFDFEPRQTARRPRL